MRDLAEARPTCQMRDLAEARPTCQMRDLAEARSTLPDARPGRGSHPVGSLIGRAAR